jgi:hypothetical protein
MLWSRGLQRTGMFSMWLQEKSLHQL